MSRIGRYLVFLVCYFVVKSNAAGHASFITPCKATDTECLLSSSKATVEHIAPGIPELGIPSADPISIKSLSSEYPGFKIGFQNITITGVSKCKFDEVSRNTEKNTVKLVVECPIVAIGQYSLNGRVIIIDAFGEGDFKIYTDNFKISVEARIKNIQKDGHRHWKLTGFDYTYDALEKIHMELENLYGGDETRARPFREFLDQSWKEVVTEFGQPLFRQLVAAYMDIAQKLFAAVPADELEIA